MALSCDGVVYAWGNQGCFQSNCEFEIIRTPIVLNCPFGSVRRIQSILEDSLALTPDGRVYSFVKGQFLNWSLSEEEKIIEVSFELTKLIIETSLHVYEVDGFNTLTTVNHHKTLFEYFLHRSQTSVKTIYLRNGETFIIDYSFCGESKKLEKVFKRINSSGSNDLINFNDLAKTLKTEVKCFY